MQSKIESRKFSTGRFSRRKKSESARALEPLFKWIALIMGEIIRVPGTQFRFGLDPLIGLIPGIGDTSSALVSAFALIQAVRLGVPKILLSRMGPQYPG